VIFSIDGRGTVTLHLPKEMGDATQLEDAKGKARQLGFSYELDDAPTFESFFFVTAQDPINVDGVLERANTLADDLTNAEKASLTLPQGMTAVDFLLKKAEEHSP